MMTGGAFDLAMKSMCNIGALLNGKLFLQEKQL